MTLTHTCPTCLTQAPATPKQLAKIRDRSAVMAGISLWQAIAITMVVGALADAESWSGLAIVLVLIGVVAPVVLFGVANLFVSLLARELHRKADRG